MGVGTAAQSSPIAATRAGTGSIVARVSGGRTVLARARATNPLRFVSPTFPGCPSAGLCLVTFGGGLVDGDAIDVEIVVERGATLVVFTQASTKVFRGASAQRFSAEVAGTLVFLPDPVAAFAGARYEQRVDVALRGDGGCVLLDGFTSGRAAYGERWAMESLDLRTTITVDGVRVLRDALVLRGAIAERMDRFEAFATLIAMGRRAAPVARAIAESGSSLGPRAPDVVVASSSHPQCPEGAIARVAATSSERALDAIRRRLRNLPEIEAVDPFGSRH